MGGGPRANPSSSLARFPLLSHEPFNPLGLQGPSSVQLTMPSQPSCPFPPGSVGRAILHWPPSGPPGEAGALVSSALPAIQAGPRFQSLCALPQLEKILKGATQKANCRAPSLEEPARHGRGQPNQQTPQQMPQSSTIEQTSFHNRTTEEAGSLCPEKKENLKPGLVSPASFSQRTLKKINT